MAAVVSSLKRVAAVTELQKDLNVLAILRYTVVALMELLRLKEGTEGVRIYRISLA